MGKIAIVTDSNSRRSTGGLKERKADSGNR